MTPNEVSPGRYAAFQTYLGYIRAWRYLTLPAPRDTWTPQRGGRLDNQTLTAITQATRRSDRHLRALKVLNDKDLTTDVLDAHLPIAYYSVYHALIAALHAHGKTVGTTHEKVLAQVARMQTSPTEALPEPWAYTCTGDPKTPIFTGSIQGIALPSSNLSQPGPHQMESYLALSLKTTHRFRYDALANQKRGNRRRLPNGEPARIISSMRPTTVFDLLYRYRRITHYGDSADFTSFSDDKEAQQFADALLIVTQSTTELLLDRSHRRMTA